VGGRWLCGKELEGRKEGRKREGFFFCDLVIGFQARWVDYNPIQNQMK